MDETRFWALIEEAWTAVGSRAKPRVKLAEGKLSEAKADALLDALEEVVPALHALLDQLSGDKLLAFDRILERKLYDIDRAEVQKYTDGSDDGFLYARGFVVAAGQKYYDAVNATPSVAMMDLECEDFCHMAYHMHEAKFGKVSPTEISRESGSNKAGWAEVPQ